MHVCTWTRCVQNYVLNTFNYFIHVVFIAAPLQYSFKQPDLGAFLLVCQTRLGTPSPFCRRSEFGWLVQHNDDREVTASSQLQYGVC